MAPSEYYHTKGEVILRGRFLDVYHHHNIDNPTLQLLMHNEKNPLKIAKHIRDAGWLVEQESYDNVCELVRAVSVLRRNARRVDDVLSSGVPAMFQKVLTALQKKEMYAADVSVAVKEKVKQKSAKDKQKGTEFAVKKALINADNVTTTAPMTKANEVKTTIAKTTTENNDMEDNDWVVVEHGDDEEAGEDDFLVTEERLDKKKVNAKPCVLKGNEGPLR